MSKLSIRPVRSRRELKRFVKVPFALHRDHPQWVPPLILDRMQFLNRRKNPYFQHAEAELFVAEREGEPVGRISAQIDSEWDRTQGGSDGMFGFFETIDDREVAGALLGAAEEWLAERGRERLLGPMDFTTNDEVGILVEGYELAPMILQNWHPPFYRRLLEDLGYGKDYVYAHDTEAGIAAMSCLPDSLAGRRYYQPRGKGFEQELARRVDAIEAWHRRRAAASDQDTRTEQEPGRPEPPTGG